MPPLRYPIHRVLLGSNSDQTVVLALRRPEGPNLGLVQPLADTFRRTFVKDAFVDIVFISEEHELQARAVAKPFHVRDSAS